VIELNTEVEQLTALKKQDDSRIVELEEQVFSETKIKLKDCVSI